MVRVFGQPQNVDITVSISSGLFNGVNIHCHFFFVCSLFCWIIKCRSSSELASRTVRATAIVELKREEYNNWMKVKTKFRVKSRQEQRPQNGNMRKMTHGNKTAFLFEESELNDEQRMAHRLYVFFLFALLANTNSPFCHNICISSLILVGWSISMAVSYKIAIDLSSTTTASAYADEYVSSVDPKSNEQN